MESYDEMNPHERLKKNMDDYGWNKPLLVQRVVMWPIKDGQDILINAQTGSGKSGAFLIPIINHILTNKRYFFRRKNLRNFLVFRAKKFAEEGMDEIPGVDCIGIDPRALIMAPTRELAIQLAKECLKLCRGFDRMYLKHQF